MPGPTTLALGAAIALAAAAAVTDARSGTIPNWLSLPPLLAAPAVYALITSLEQGLLSAVSAVVSGVGPYLLFRRKAIGGGDVKLFAALGAVTGFDPLLGLRIQVVAFAVALFGALCLQAWRGRLLATLASAVAIPLNKVLPARYQLRVREDLRTPVRMGGAILAATATCALPHMVAPGGGL